MAKERATDNVDGPFYAAKIEFDCGCGLPEDEAPDLIRMSDSRAYQSYFYKQPKTEEEIDRAIEAINICPIHDLRYGGQDLKIIARVNPEQADFQVVNGKAIPNDKNT